MLGQLRAAATEPRRATLGDLVRPLRQAALEASLRVDLVEERHVLSRKAGEAMEEDERADGLAGRRTRDLPESHPARIFPGEAQRRAPAHVGNGGVTRLYASLSEEEFPSTRAPGRAWPRDRAMPSSRAASRLSSTASAPT